MLYFAIISSIFLFILSRKKWNSVIGYGLSPTCLYSAIWGGIWLILLLNPFNYHQVSNIALFYSLIPLIAIYIGERIGILGKRKALKQEFRIPNLAFKKIVLSFGLIVFILGLLFFAVATLMFGPFWQSGGGIELKLARSTLGSEAYGSSPIGIIAKYYNLVLGLGNLTFIWALHYNLLSKTNSKLLIFLPLIGIILIGISLGARAQIVNMFVIYLCYFVVLNIKNKKILNLKFVFIVLILFSLMIIITSSTRGDNLIDVDGIGYSRTLIQGFDYYVGPLIAFDNTLKYNQSTFGRLSFSGIEDVLRMMKIVSAPVPNVYYLLEGSITFVGRESSYLRTVNTYSWLLFLFYDFHIIGLFFVPFIIALSYTKETLKLFFNINKSIIRVTYLILILSILTSSTGTFIFRNLSFIISLITLGIFSIIEKKYNFYNK